LGPSTVIITNILQNSFFCVQQKKKLTADYSILDAILAYSLIENQWHSKCSVKWKQSFNLQWWQVLIV